MFLCRRLLLFSFRARASHLHLGTWEQFPLSGAMLVEGIGFHVISEPSQTNKSPFERVCWEPGAKSVPATVDGLKVLRITRRWKTNNMNLPANEQGRLKLSKGAPLHSTASCMNQMCLDHFICQILPVGNNRK